MRRGVRTYHLDEGGQRILRTTFVRVGGPSLSGLPLLIKRWAFGPFFDLLKGVMILYRWLTRVIFRPANFATLKITVVGLRENYAVPGDKPRTNPKKFLDKRGAEPIGGFAFCACRSNVCRWDWYGASTYRYFPSSNFLIF